MKKSPPAALMGFLLTGLLSSSGSQAATSNDHALELGVDRSHLAYVSEAEQQKTFADMRAVHAVWFRDGPDSYSDQPKNLVKFVGEMQLAKKYGLKILVGVGPIDADFDNYNKAAPRNKCGWSDRKWGAVNLDLFTRRLKRVFTALKAANIDVDAFEIGNEEDSNCYDGDIPSGHEASEEEIVTALRGYSRVLKAAAVVIRNPQYFPQAKIITFGIAHGGNKKESLVDPAGYVARLKNLDGYNYLDNDSYHVDGYGTHVYAWPGDIAGSITNTLHSDVTSLGTDKPLWVTEWGFLNLKAFPTKTGLTIQQAMQQFLDTFQALNRQIPIGPIMYYAYNPDPSLWVPQADILMTYR